MKCPKIRKTSGKYKQYGKYIVDSGCSSDIVNDLCMAIRYWMWHCGVSPKIAFLKFKKR